jgi:hypothetical protein
MTEKEKAKTKSFNTEGTEKEHRVHGEEKPKSTARNGCATRAGVGFGDGFWA